MIQENLQQWILHPESLSEESLEQLRELLSRYPYFQTARLLYLKNLYLLQSPDFKAELQKSALYIADLSVLFYFIEGERLSIKQHTNDKKTPANASDTDRTLDLIDRFLSGTPESLGNDLPLPAEANMEYATILLKEGTKPEKATPMKGQELIDRFIENTQSHETPAAPSLQEENEPDDEEAQTETENDENYFTETLAKIYVKQHRYEKALEIIKKLNLKYPKKNAYFADQMRFLEKLIINAKSK